MSKYQRLQLAFRNEINFILVVPSTTNDDKYPLHFIEYFVYGKQFKYKEGVKQLYLSWNKKDKLEIIFEEKLAKLQDTIQKNNTTNTSTKITIFSALQEAVDLFFKYHNQRFDLGEIQDIYNYRERNKKLSGYISKQYSDSLLSDLTANVWVNYRSYLKGIGLGNSTINLQMIYVTQFYIWLQEIHEVAIPNHAKKLKKLDISKQVPKFNEIENNLFKEFFEVVGKDDRYLRLHLMTRLVAENTLRPIQVRQLKVQDVDLAKSKINIFDNKGKKGRIIIISDETKALIQKIFDNTLEAKRIPAKEDYLIGYRNQTKQLKPYTQSMFRDSIILPFKEEFPQFEHILVYDFKHTSITKAFQVHSLYEVQKRAGHTKSTTTAIYDRSQLISKPISVEELGNIG